MFRNDILILFGFALNNVSVLQNSVIFQACEQRNRVPKGITNDPDDIITMVIQVFVDSYPYIPEHRRQLLFNKLLKVTGVERYLWRTLLLMMKHVVTKGTLRAELTTDSQEVTNFYSCIFMHTCKQILFKPPKTNFITVK